MRIPSFLALPVRALPLLGLCSPGVAQATDWVPKEQIRRLSGPTMTFDEGRGRAVVFGGMSGLLSLFPRDDTWEWEGRRWSKRNPVTVPRRRMQSAMCYDSRRRNVVMFGGLGGQPIPGFVFLDDTWIWDGVNWLQQTTAVPPPPRVGPGLVFDAKRGRAVLHGGVTGSRRAPIEMADTWEWDGSSWSQVTAATNPGLRNNFAMAYDAARERTILFGGLRGVSNNPLLLGDTWEWDGRTWRMLPATGPTARGGAKLAYDAKRRRLVLFGGIGANGPLHDTWTFDGVRWQKVATTRQPDVAVEHELAWDSRRERVLLFGGTREARSSSATWEFDGADWQQRTGNLSPPLLDDPAMGFDQRRGVAVLFGGAETFVFPSSDTWEWDGQQWALRNLTTKPSARQAADLVYDGARRRMLLFGGESLLANVFADTWSYDGSTWQQHRPQVSPPPRARHKLAYDSKRGRVVLFGGDVHQLLQLGDTWEWNGSTWTEHKPATSPPPRSGHALAYDPIRGETILFGGDGVLSAYKDTWSWNGTTWKQLHPKTVPPANGEPLLAFDATRQRLVLSTLGGAETYEWDGSDWHKSQAQKVIAGRMFYDTVRAATVMFDGWDMWAYTSRPLATARSVGRGCGGTTVPRLSAYGRPFSGNGSFGLDLARTPPNAAALVLFTATGANRTIGPCTLRVELGTLVVARPVVTGPTGFGFVGVPVPAQLALTGLGLHTQSAVLDAAGPFLGFSLSGGVSWTIGE